MFKGQLMNFELLGKTLLKDIRILHEDVHIQRNTQRVCIKKRNCKMTRSVSDDSA